MKKIKISRKSFLWGTLGTGTFLYFLSLFLGKNVKTLFFSKFQLNVLVLFLSSLLSNNFSKDEAYLNKLLQRMDEELFFVNEGIQGEFDAAILLVEFCPWIFGYWSSFSKLSLEDARSCIQDGINSQNHSIRSAFSSIRMLSYMIHYGQKESWNAIHYDGPFAGFSEKFSESRAYYKKQVGI
ncbi:MAG: hypothetical protein O9346_05315 [Leptospiraceae bacterium]|nr:hypothetical protein [Leptospiraceae bacterium]